MSKAVNKSKRRRRLPQWSMATMFLGITVVCLVLGLVVRPAEEQKRVVAALLDADVRWINHSVEIIYDFEAPYLAEPPIEPTMPAEILPPGPDWLRDLIGIDYFANVVEVHFRVFRVRDNDLRLLSQLNALKSLTILTDEGITDNDLRHLGKLTELKWLDLRSNDHTALPVEIGNLNNLTSLWLVSNQLTTLPPEIGQLTDLKELGLFQNQLTALPPEFGKLTKLTQLWLFRNKLTTLPPEIGKLTCLTELECSHNELTSLPPEIGRLAKLKSLDLSGNYLTALLPEIGKLVNLTELDYSYNELTSLPSEIGKLANLTQLHLENNKLTVLPPEIGQLTKLTKLFLGDNPLNDDALKHLTSLKGLKELHITDTKITKSGIAAFSRALPACKIILTETQDAQVGEYIDLNDL